LLLAYSNSNVVVERLQSLLDSYLRQEKYSKVVAHFGKPAMVEDAPRNRLQIVLADVGVYRGDCVDLADILAARVRNSKLKSAREAPTFSLSELPVSNNTKMWACERVR
jgi:hypothetical protein